MVWNDGLQRCVDLDQLVDEQRAVCKSADEEEIFDAFAPTHQLTRMIRRLTNHLGEEGMYQVICTTAHTEKHPR